MISATWSTCALCPRLCRTACPVATGSSREAAVPTLIATVVGQWEAGEVDRALAAQAATLCTNCGGCQDRCHLNRPLPQFLAEARAKLLDPPSIEPLRSIEGEGRWVAIEADHRPMASALAEALGHDVARLYTADQFGVAAIEHPVIEPRVLRLQALLAGRELVVADGGVAEVLKRAGLDFQWLHQVVPAPEGAAGSCQTAGARPAACCGAAGPLAAHHPEDARRVGALWLDRAENWRVDDARCRNHLRKCGGEVTDTLDVLLLAHPVSES